MTAVAAAKPENATCARCGAQSPLKSLFRRDHFNRKQRVCPGCADESGGRLWLALLIASIAFAAIRLSLDVRDTWRGVSHDRSTEPLFLELLTVAYTFQAVSIVAHELGHAVGAWLMGAEIGRITIGRGRLLLRGRAGRVLLELRAYLMMGTVSAIIEDERGYRWRQFTYLASGLLTHVLIIAIAVAGSRLASVSVAAGGLTPSPLSQDLDLLAFVNLVLLAANLWPRTIHTGAGANASDGRKLLWLLTKPLPSPSERRQRNFITRASWDLQAAISAEHMPALAQRAAEFPDNVTIQSLLVLAHLKQRDYTTARAMTQAMLLKTEKPSRQRAMLLNNLAWADLMLDDPALLDEADSASAESHHLAPWSPSVQGTRGLLLVERGRIEEGLTLLEAALPRHETPAPKAAVLLSLAIAKARQRQMDAAEELFRRALSYDPENEVMSRAKRTLLA